MITRRGGARVSLCALPFPIGLHRSTHIIAPNLLLLLVLVLIPASWHPLVMPQGSAVRVIMSNVAMSNVAMSFVAVSNELELAHNPLLRLVLLLPGPRRLLLRM